jgi:hypothetical protein
LKAYRSNTFLIDLTSAIYMWIDYASNVYLYGICESIPTSIYTKEETHRRHIFYISYRVLSAVPMSFFSAFISITLSYKTWLSLKDYIRRYKSSIDRSLMEQKSRDSMFCMIANVDDDNETFYSRFFLNQLLNIHILGKAIN